MINKMHWSFMHWNPLINFGLQLPFCSAVLPMSLLC